MGQSLQTLFHRTRDRQSSADAPTGYLPSAKDLGTLKDEPKVNDKVKVKGKGKYDVTSPDQVKVKVKSKRKSEPPAVPLPAKPEGLTVKAMYDFVAVNEDDLSFRKGDRMLVDESTKEQEWWAATHLETNEKGYIPSNYVCIDDNSPQAQDWWFPSDRKEADLMLLLPGNTDGTFLVRESHDKKSYVLSVRQEVGTTGDPGVKHYRIKPMDNGRFYISPGKNFPDLLALIENYKSDGGLCTRLSVPCPRLRPLQLRFDDLEMDRSHVQMTTKLGHGHFGEVWKAKLNNTVEVAVKMLKKDSMSPEDFLREATIMHKLRHRKLVNLLGVCSEDEPIYIVTEFMVHGALLDFLRVDANKLLVRFPALIKMAAQIADGMHFLEQANFIHRDLRAANILVGEHYDVKVADFGLARILYDDETYDASADAKFPIKWTAPEAGLKRKFSVKSDVWSFGILLYELITYGRVPYPGIYGEILLKVDSGYRMANPAGPNLVCPDPVYDVMKLCWSHDPAQRPTFEYLKNFFEDYEISSEAQYAVE